MSENNLTIEDYEAMYGSADLLRQGQTRPSPDPTVFHAETEGQKAYMEKFNKVSEKPALSFEGILQRVDQQVIRRANFKNTCPLNYEQARVAFWRGYKGVLDAKGKELIIDGNLKEVLREIVKWSIGDPSGEYPTDKGLYLYGGVGVGKTDIIRALEDFHRAINYETFKTVNVPDIAQRIKITKDYAVLNPYQSGRWCFDDLAADKTTQTYGNSDDVTIMLLFAWYEHQHRDGMLLIATGNEAPARIQDRYQDTRFYDRFNELLHPVLLTGKSKRK